MSSSVDFDKAADGLRCRIASLLAENRGAAQLGRKFRSLPTFVRIQHFQTGQTTANEK